MSRRPWFLASMSHIYEPASFVYVKIPLVPGTEGLYPARDEVMDQMLREGGVGTVLGWGDSIGQRRADGSRPVEFHRIDVEIADLVQGREALRQILLGLDVPPGSEINFSRDGRKLQDVYSASGWLLDRPFPYLSAPA